MTSSMANTQYSLKKQIFVKSIEEMESDEETRAEIVPKTLNISYTYNKLHLKPEEAYKEPAEPEVKLNTDCLNTNRLNQSNKLSTHTSLETPITNNGTVEPVI